MSDDKVFKNLGKFLSYEEKDLGKGLMKINVLYTQPKYQDPAKEWTMGILEKDISETLLDKIVALSAGEEVCIHTKKNDKGFYELHDITDKKDAEFKPATGKPYVKSSGKGAYDDTGVAVGAAFKDAIEIVKLSAIGDGAIDHLLVLVGDTAQKVLDLKLAMEAKLRASKAGKTAVAKDTTVEVAKPLTALEKAKAKKAAAKKETPIVTDETSAHNEVVDTVDLDEVVEEGDVVEEVEF